MDTSKAIIPYMKATGFHLTSVQNQRRFLDFSPNESLFFSFYFFN